MDRKNKIFFAVFFALIAAVVILTFVKYFIAKDYYVEAEADCDPETEKCFIWKCDPASSKEGEKCTGDPEEDIWYFKKVRKKAIDIPLCDPKEESCEAFVCHPGEDCQEFLCNEGNAGGGQCNDPEAYMLENAEEEESEECEEGDEECASDEECEENDEECVGSEAEECEESDKECARSEKTDDSDEEKKDDGKSSKDKNDAKEDESGSAGEISNFMS